MQKNIKKFGSIFSLSLFFWLGFHLSVRAFECQGDYCLECPVKNLQDDVNVPLSLRATTQQFSNKQEVARFCREKIFFEKTGPFVLNKPLVLDFPEDQDSDQDNWNFILDGKVGNQNAIIDGTELAPGQCALIVNTPLVLLQNLQIRSATCELAVCTGPEGSFDHANVKIVSLDQGDNDGDLICKSYTDPEKKPDNCPGTYNPSQKDSDQDGIGDACDGCPFDPNKTKPGVCGCGVVETDSDGDGVPDDCDICLGGNDNVDFDGDGVPNFCDICPGHDDKKDSDGDGKPDGCDPCPFIHSKITDICDIQVLDSDGDGVPDGTDNCVNIPNPNQVDWDMDGVGDACDICIGFDDNVDSDGDFQPDGCDVCPGADDFLDLNNNGIPDDCEDDDQDEVPNPQDICPQGDDNIDTDGDGVPDGCDVCPGGDDFLDLNNNGIPDACETPGSEGDVVPDEEDNCPRLANPLQDYEDQDAWGDACGPLPQASSITFTYGGCQLNARAASPLLFWVGPLLLGLGLILKVLKMREER